MKGKAVFRALVGAYLLTTLLLLLLAFLLFKFDLQEKLVSVGISAIYIISCFLGGLIAGRSTAHRQYLWGLVAGALYFTLLTGVSLLIEREGGVQMSQLLMSLCLCAAGGTLGGMLAH